MATDQAILYLIPSFLADGQLGTLPPEIGQAVRDCQVFYVEQARSARRFLKQVWKEMEIDRFEWMQLDKDNPASAEVLNHLKKTLGAGKHAGIISEAGCPGIADPGQALVSLAQEMGVKVKPLTGPSSIILALMASGFNGQQFRFHGYLPVEAQERKKTIRKLEEESAREHCTQLFIETPYRNNALLQALVTGCRMNTRLCVAVDLTSPQEWVRTLTVGEWKNQMPDLHKRPAIFCLYAG